MKQRHVVGGGEGDAAEVRVDRMRKARKVVDVLDQVAVVHRVLFFSAKCGSRRSHGAMAVKTWQLRGESPVTDLSMGRTDPPTETQQSRRTHQACESPVTAPHQPSWLIYVEP